MPAWGNSEVAPSAIWHTKNDIVALEILQGRKLSVLWVWRHGKGLRIFTEAEMLKVLGIRTVILPEFAGGLSALGMLLADRTRDYSASVSATRVG